MAKKVRGLYRRPDSDIWWTSYTTADGRRVRESTGTADYDTAKRVLDDKRGRLARGEILLPRLDKITYNEARADLLDYYETRQTRDPAEAERRLAHLDPFFAGRRLASVTPDIVTAYARSRQSEGAANGTINRELATLSKLLRLAYKHGKLPRLPVVEKMPEAAPRAGFVTREQFVTIRQHLPEELRVAVTVAYTFGWRKREVLNLRRHHYNPQDGTLRLDPGTTKNREGRVIRLTPELRTLLDAQVERVRELEREAERVVEPRKPWLAACAAAGLPGILIHDLRRSAVRNMEQAEVSRSVAMKLTGHKTESVYRRYAIVSAADLEEAARRLAGIPSGSVTVLSRSAGAAGKGVSQLREEMVGRDGIEPPTPGFSGLERGAWKCA